MVRLAPTGPGGPYPMQISGRNTIMLHDILVGDVWLCSATGLTTSDGEDPQEFAIAGADKPDQQGRFAGSAFQDWGVTAGLLLLLPAMCELYNYFTAACKHSAELSG